MVTDIAGILLCLAVGLVIISFVTKLVDPKGKLASPWFFLRPALILGLLGAALLLIVHYTTNTISCGDYGMAVVRMLQN